ncbi:hypothetical protein TSOC_012089 [Tetrabaena socialis]|uniref:Uncharacterized protein n=1 Tax=Tetrabaena socialis TaxID=47790 RepID=A0A2J7ZNY6_9CHLO|nr:hypothetical protein TSOC_012089 [Tetrabaena socialis]|eukprot:PNH01970.1 hypothetical protein TSOC_012089 [Tetrabaena socialis]
MAAAGCRGDPAVGWLGITWVRPGPDGPLLGQHPGGQGGRCREHRGRHRVVATGMKIKVLRPDLLLRGREQYIGVGSGTDTKKWSDVDGLLLQFPDSAAGGRPARRLLAWHAGIAIKHAVLNGWQQQGAVVIPPSAGWASPGYDQGLMDRFLASTQVVKEGDAESTGEGTEL